MFDWIPFEYYTAVHYHALLLLIIVMLFHAFHFDINNQQSITFFNVLGYWIVGLLVLYMSQRPISGYYFGDTAVYEAAYRNMQLGKTVVINKDFVFNYFMKWCSQYMSVHNFFLLVDILYVVPCAIFCRKYFGHYWFFTMMFIISSFSFWSYGVNGIRNGLGTSFFLLGLYFYSKRTWMYLLFGLGYLMHASIIIPIAAFVTAALYRNPKFYIFVWLIAIPLSLVGGGFWTSFFSSIGLEEERSAGYLTGGLEEFQSQFSNIGFRWDFLLYSATPIFFGWYFIFKKKINDQFYIHLFGIYSIANAFWILVITAAFSNRFAYLSWFLMPIVISYPIFRYKIWKDQYRVGALILLAYFLFTYFMNVII